MVSPCLNLGLWGIYKQIEGNKMKELMIENKLVMPEVIIVGNEPVTTSQAIALYFDKNHDKIVKQIESLDCSSVILSRTSLGSIFSCLAHLIGSTPSTNLFK